MSDARILITVNGMGDPDAGSTFAWSRALFPDAEEHTADGRRWLDTADGRVYLLEVRYEDVNDMLLAKHQGLREGLRDLIPENTPDVVEETLEEFVLDVVEQVLVKEALDAAQMEFLGTYVEALRIAGDEAGDDGDPRTIGIGVLAHSLGTLVAFEGLHRAADSEDILHFLDVNLVLCAPMLAPMHAVQSHLPAQSHRYLVDRGPVKPTRHNAFLGTDEPVIGTGLLFYDTDDPFHRIHSDAFYDVPGPKLADEIVKYASHPDLFWKGHDMLGSYLAHNRDRIVEGLFS